MDKKILDDILIVDDDKDICEILSKHCENMRCFERFAR